MSEDSGKPAEESTESGALGICMRGRFAPGWPGSEPRWTSGAKSGVGTGLGSAMIVDGLVEPMELDHFPHRKGRSYEDYVGSAGLKRLGKKKWRRHVFAVIELLRSALEPE